MKTAVIPAPPGATAEGFLRSLDRDHVVALVTQHLLAGPLAATHRVHAAVPAYVRWKRGDGALVGYRLELVGPAGRTSTHVTLRSADPERLRAEADALAPRAKEALLDLRPFALLPAEGLLLLAFPVDREVRALRDLVRASRVRDLVTRIAPHLVPSGLRVSKSRSELAVVRFKPERRAVLRWNLAIVDEGGEERAAVPLWFRAHAGDEATAAFAAQRAALAVGVPVPRPLARPRPDLAIEHELVPDPSRAVEPRALGELLARLHAAPHPAELAGHDAAGELALAHRAASDLAELGTDIGHLAAECVRALAARADHFAALDGPRVLLHGDFHPGQVVVGPQGPGLVDFDRARLGAPEFDLASWSARECAAAPESTATSSSALQLGYRESGARLRPDFLVWAHASALVRVAATPFRTLDPRWPELVARILERARQALAVSVP